MPRAAPTTGNPPRLPSGIRIIILYKFAKAALELVLAGLLPVLILTGLAEHVHALTLSLRHHMVSVWSLRAANLLVALTTVSHLSLTAIALALDGTLTSVEGWSLWRGYTWGPWLVVVATASLIPFELWDLVKAPRIGRGLLVALNAGVAFYLLRRARRERPKAA